MIKKLSILLISIGLLTPIANAQKLQEDFKIVTKVLAELENRNWFPADIYPILPPPPESKEWYRNLKKDDLTTQQADSLFDFFERKYNEYLERRSNRKIDSTYTYLFTDNYLSGAKCKWCSNISHKSVDYSRYGKLAKRLNKGRLKDLEIPFKKLNYEGKYKLKQNNEFSNINEIYEGNLNYLSGGEISFSRFYHENNLGVIYFGMATCPTDCSSTYLVLLEKQKGDWIIIDMLLQSIT